MLGIYPTANVNFQSQNSLRFQKTNADKPKKSHKEVKLALTLAGLLLLQQVPYGLRKMQQNHLKRRLKEAV